jgi:hypothetical protein
MALLYERAACLTVKNGGFRPGQVNAAEFIFYYQQSSGFGSCYVKSRGAIIIIIIWFIIVSGGIIMGLITVPLFSLITVQARPRGSSGLGVPRSESILYAFVWGRRALNRPKRRLPARADGDAPPAAAALQEIQDDREGHHQVSVATSLQEQRHRLS